MEALHWFLDPLKYHYADFDGRASREQFWMYIIGTLLVMAALTLLGSGLLIGLVSLGLFVPNLAITARRLHDVDKSGWWMFITLIPLAGWIILIVFLAQSGQSGDNRFGTNPLAQGDPVPAAPLSEVPAPGVTPHTTTEDQV